MERSETGRSGEQATVEYLRERGYEICATNWRSGNYELDIVAQNGDTLHFVEVKTRKRGGLTSPHSAITPQKCRALHKAACAYMAWSKTTLEISFDLAAVEIDSHGNTQIDYIENAIEYNW